MAISSADMVVTLENQLAGIITAKAAATAQLASVVTAGPTMERHDSEGGESYDYNGLITALTNTIKNLADTENLILKEIQALQPYVVKSHRCHGSGMIW